MKLKRVNPSTIMIPELRVTARFDEEKLSMFRESIATTGQVAPIICVQVEDQVVLVDGLHRLQEAIASKQPLIDVVITDGDMTDVLTKNIFIDHLRGKTPPSEMRQVIAALYAEYHLGIEDIQKKTGLTRDYVEKLLNLSKLTPFLLEAVDEEHLSVGLATALMKIDDPIRQEIVWQVIESNHWKGQRALDYVKEVLAIREQMAAPPAPPPPELPRTATCQYCRRELPPERLASVITCPECSSIMYEAVALARRDAAETAQADKNATTGQNTGTSIP